jgi:hypothetical protein
MRKKVPYIFLGILIVIVIFILGVKLGGRVEKTNKVIDVILSLPPTKTPAPTKPIAFDTFKHKECGIQFLYPKTLKAEKISTEDAHLVANGTDEEIYVNCSKSNYLTTILNENNVTTSEAQLKNQKIKIYTLKTDSQEFASFQVKNPSNGKLITVVIDKNLYPLFENTVQYFK